MNTAAWSLAQDWQSCLGIRKSSTHSTMWLAELQLER